MSGQKKTVYKKQKLY